MTIKRTIIALGGLLLLAALFPASAGAQDDATFNVVDAATYDFDQPFPITFCFDGVAQDLERGDITAPESVTPGTYPVEVIFGSGQTCGIDPDFSTDVDLAAGDDVTLLIFWNTQVGVSVLPNDTSCVEPGTGRLTVRHGAAADAVDVESDGDVLLSGVEPGDQGSVDLDAGDYPDALVVDDLGTVADLGTLTIEEGQNVIVYLAGGNDGDTGAFLDVVDLEVCEQPTTTTTSTTAPPATPVAASPAAVTAATPQFTG
jgi:Domain of unknown function (DUF4397)